MAVIDEGKVNKQVETGETQETPILKTVIGSDKEYDGTADSKSYGPAPGLTVSEDTEVNSTRFEYRYHSYLDLLSSLFPNALAIHLASQSGDWSGVSNDIESELDADMLDKMLDIDHFVKDFRKGNWDVDSETEEKINQLYKVACAFYNEDNIGKPLPDYGDTKINENNGSDQVNWGGRDYIFSGMDARYSDMKVAVENIEVDDEERQEANAFSVNKVDVSNLHSLSEFVAAAFDLNNDGYVGTDDVALILKVYAGALNADTWNDDWGTFVGHTGQDSTTGDSYPLISTQFSKNAEHLVFDADEVTKDYVNNSSVDESGNDFYLNFYKYSLLHRITLYDISTQSEESHYFNNFFHTIDSAKDTLNHKLNFLDAIAKLDSSFNLIDNDGVQVPLSRTIKVGNTTKTLCEVFHDIATEFNSLFSKLNDRTVKSSELATAFSEIILKYGDPNRGNASVSKLGSHLEGLYKSKITDLYNFDNWQDYYKSLTYSDNHVDTKGWNESVNDLYDFMKVYFENNGLDPTKFQTPQAWLQALKEANAKGTATGHYLDPTPLVNLFNEIYKEERSDEIKMNVYHMDYTNEGEELSSDAGITSDGQTYNYGELIAYVVNLLMPQYRRRVEVEDLNKNFWVISQVLSILLNQVFGDDGLEAILKGHMAEIMELWNNVKYLWNVIDAQGKMINDLAIALKESKGADDVDIEMYRDVYQYRSESYINPDVTDDKYHWSGAMWDLNGDNYVNGYETNTIQLLNNNDLIENSIIYRGTDNNNHTITPGSIDTFYDQITLEYTDKGSTRTLNFKWPFEKHSKAYWDNGGGQPLNMFYTIDGNGEDDSGIYDQPPTKGFNLRSDNNLLLNENDTATYGTYYGLLNSIDGERDDNYNSSNINLTYSRGLGDNGWRNGEVYLGDIMSGLFRLCFVNVNNIKGRTETSHTIFTKSIGADGDINNPQEFKITQNDTLRPIFENENEFALWNQTQWTHLTNKDGYENNSRDLLHTIRNGFVFQDFSGYNWGFWGNSNTEKTFENKFLCRIKNGNVDNLYMLCAVARSSISYTTNYPDMITMNDVGPRTQKYSCSTSQGSADGYFYGLYPVEVDNFLATEVGEIESLQWPNDNRPSNCLSFKNCVYTEITSNQQYGKGRDMRRQVAINMLKKATILAGLQYTEGYPAMLNPEVATALMNTMKSRWRTDYKGITVDNVFKAVLDGANTTEEKIIITGKNNSIILSGIVDENQTNLEKVVAINQHFEIKERPLRIWSKDGNTISRVEHISPTFTRTKDGVEESFTVSYTNYPIYQSEKVLDNYEEQDVSIWGGMSSSLNTWFPQYGVGQNFIPNQYSDSINFVCETSIAERLYELNTYTGLTDNDSFFVTFTMNGTEYETSDVPVVTDDFTVTYPTPEYGIKVKG